MKCYFCNVLRGFKSKDASIDLECRVRQTPNFVLVDIDQDAMPEILFTYMYDDEKYIAILKRKDMKWYFMDTMPESEHKTIGLGNLVNTIENSSITPALVGEVVELEQLFGEENQPFVAFINDMAYHGIVIQPTRENSKTSKDANSTVDLINLTLEQLQSITNPQLPPVEKVNTEQAQKALQQNVTTPITSITETDNVVNAGIQQILDLFNLTPEQLQAIFTAQLPPAENINTEEAQDALAQNVITPITSITETDQVVNAGMQQILDLLNLTPEQFQVITSGQLQAPENINTQQAQEALDQNVITPITSINETNQVVNEEGQSPIANGNSTADYQAVLDKEVINFTQADVTGDGMQDSIYLVGDRQTGNSTDRIRNMGLRVQTGGKTLSVDFPYGDGYSPILFVGDLTANGIPDVLVNIFASGSGGFITSYIYTFENEQPRLLFDSKIFNENYTGKVIYEDNYKVRVITNRPRWQYTIDISDRDRAYLATLYDINGKLRQPTEGALLGLSSLNPIDYDVNGEFNVSAIQRVIGIGNMDTLGLVETYLRWRGATNRFEPFMQYLSVLGRPL